MARFAEQDHSRISESVKHRSEARVVEILGQRLRGLADQLA
jgi:hypothetical protein